MLTKKARDRAYHVSMHALSEEHRVCKLSNEELVRRQNEIWQDCYGDLTEKEKSKEKVQ